VTHGFLGQNGRESSETLGFPGFRRKSHAERRGASGKCGFIGLDLSLRLSRRGTFSAVSGGAGNVTPAPQAFAARSLTPPPRTHIATRPVAQGPRPPWAPFASFAHAYRTSPGCGCRQRGRAFRHRLGPDGQRTPGRALREDNRPLTENGGGL